jgi:hypothetical protein
LKALRADNVWIELRDKDSKWSCILYSFISLLFIHARQSPKGRGGSVQGRRADGLSCRRLAA